MHAHEDSVWKIRARVVSGCFTLNIILIIEISVRGILIKKECSYRCFHAELCMKMLNRKDWEMDGIVETKKEYS